MKRFIITGLLIFIMISCYSPNRYWLARKNKKVDWDSLYKSDTIIMPDTNAVYLYHSLYTGEDSHLTSYSFQRYFSNGRVYSSKSFKEMPSKSDFNQMPVHPWNNWIGGTKHYYDITEDGYLRRELFINRKDGYYYIFAKVYSDSIVTFKRQMGRGFYGRCCASKHYSRGIGVRIPVKFESYEVDW